MGDHLSGTRLSVCLVQLTRGCGFLTETGRRAVSREPAFALLLLSLAPGGGCLAAAIADSAGGLLHHLFTLTLTPDPFPEGKEFEVRAVIFCGPIRQVDPVLGLTPSRVLPGAMPYGVRTFLDPAWAEPRSPSQPGKFIIHCKLNRIML
jgi:hypothetical protein